MILKYMEQQKTMNSLDNLKDEESGRTEKTTFKNERLWQTKVNLGELAQ